MRLTTTTLIVATLTLSACGAIRDSRVNPFNWFGNSRSAPIEADSQAEVNPLIPERRRAGLFSSLRAQEQVYIGTPIDQVSDLVIERVPGGAIVRATGITAVDNVYDVRLTTVDDDEVQADENGVLTLRLRGVKPERRSRTTSQRVRTVTAGMRLSDKELSRIRAIRVEGRRNVQTSSRL
ncbi:hypothetical protein [Tateyamaria sp. SN3-11]|uniref:hypothetical protein n=1 Tax=Tateyamaria sp. SN3-11 TaxID=3092147 RepID=UPI0039E9A037